MKKHILTGLILSLILTSATAYAGSTAIHVGATFHFKKHDLIKIHDRYFTLERDSQGMEAYEISHASGEHILIVH